MKTKLLSGFGNIIEKRKKGISEAELYEKIVEDHLRILGESGDLMARTTNADTFFNRYEDFLAVAERLAELAENHPLPARGKMREDMEKAIAVMENDALKTTLMFRFLDRAVAAGKGPLLQQEMWKYEALMTEGAIAYWNARMRETKEPYENQEGEYMVCWVAFDGGGKTYCYLSDDPSLEAGDHVIVPVGNYGKEAPAVIRRIAWYDTDQPEDFPYPLSKMKRISGKDAGRKLLYSK